MRARGFVVSILSLAAWSTPLQAQTPEKNPPSRVVGHVYGKPITAGDIGLTSPADRFKEFDARDTPAWEQMGRISEAFGRPVMERFIASRKLVATPDELAAYRRVNLKVKEQTLRETEARLSKLKEELATPDLPAEKKAKLEKLREAIERGLPAQREFARNADEDDTFGRALIISWKFERELYRTYKGRLIWQQFGIEALDARRQLFEEAEKKGDLKFDDPGVRRLFYHYSNMGHTFVREDHQKKLEEKPWFLDDRAEPLP